MVTRRHRSRDHLIPGSSEIFNVECNTMYMTLERPLNKGQGHSFWYQSISHYTISYMLSIVTVALGRAV